MNQKNKKIIWILLILLFLFYIVGIECFVDSLNFIRISRYIFGGGIAIVLLIENIQNKHIISNILLIILAIFTTFIFECVVDTISVINSFGDQLTLSWFTTIPGKYFRLWYFILWIIMLYRTFKYSKNKKIFIIMTLFLIRFQFIKMMLLSSHQICPVENINLNEGIFERSKMWGRELPVFLTYINLFVYGFNNKPKVSNDVINKNLKKG